MSTVGKVLVILIIIAILGMMFEMSLVAERNANWSKFIAEQKKVLAEREEEIPKVDAEANQYKDEATTQQVRNDHFRTNFRKELAALQRFESNTKEELLRVQLELQSMESTIKLAQSRYETRLKEKNDLTKEWDQKEAAAQEAIAENSRLRSELKGLQDRFQKTMAENRTMADSLLKPNRSTSRDTAKTRLGSLVR